ncbi:hypothetical protein AWW66_22260 [Micromonospora rosaria]|uniref:Pycsar effector protein domain-containing protein n=1 Tax=Micromonospora rosaria TaxID=47874 RepID=A0A136PN72_9ACTN|nr:hypothetical protein AWW66_22260 [Micromonospora rosaria]
MDAEVTAVRAELHRVDPKASGYLQMAGVLLGAGLAVLGGAAAGGHLPTAAVRVGAGTAVVVLAAVTLLLLASRPRLGAGDFGFMAYADADDAHGVLARVAGGDADHVAQMTPLSRARELWWLSRATRAKYQAIGRAVPLLLAGYLGAAATVALAIWGR